MIWNGPGRLWTTPLSPGPFHCERSGLACATGLASPAAGERAPSPGPRPVTAAASSTTASSTRQRIAALRAEQTHLREKTGWYRSQLAADDAQSPRLAAAGRRRRLSATPSAGCSAVIESPSRRPGIGTLFSPSPRFTGRAQMRVSVCSSGRRLPPTAHNDARGRKRGSQTAHDHDSRPGRPNAWATAAPIPPTAWSRAPDGGGRAGRRPARLTRRQAAPLTGWVSGLGSLYSLHENPDEFPR